MKKLMRKALAFMTAGMLALLPLAGTAYAEEGFHSEYARLMDAADLLTDAEEAEILAALDEISERQKVDVAIAAVDSLDGKDVQSYADELYEYCSFGYGDAHDGFMLLISMEERDWYITTEGYGITAITDAGIEHLGSVMSDNLSAGNYAAAFMDFAETGDEMITQAKDGSPYGAEDKSVNAIMILGISFVLALVVSSIVVGRMKAELKSVQMERSAANYIREGSMQLTKQQDLFLYRHVSRTKRQKSSSSGSSTHRSSSGRTHGGGGGKF